MHSRPAPSGALRPDRPRPLRSLATLTTVALVLLAGLATSAASVDVRATAPPGRPLAAPDTDSVATDAVLRLGSARSDSTRADSVRSDSARVARYLPSWRGSRTATLFPRRRPLMPEPGPFWNREIVLDSTGRSYTLRERVGEGDVRYPLRLDYDAYRQARLTQDLNQNFRELAEQRAIQRQQQGRRGLGVNIVVPGGRQSAFSTIFGKPEVDLRVNGQADIRAGFNYRKSDQQVAITGRASQTDPDFKQDLRLGITGTIGDKLRVDVNWDTNNDFDYQNQLKLQYTGYEDEIIQSIEAGNVFLETPSTLIRGGQSLFGIKSELQFGGVHLTTVASQQEGQSNTLSIEGGSETTRFDLLPTEYDASTHFFLAYYFRNRWEEALSQPPDILLADGFQGIQEVEVWKLQRTDVSDQDVRNVASVVDLGEEPEILNQTEGNLYAEEVLPNEAIDQYGPADINLLRNGTTQPQDFLESRGLEASDYQLGGTFKKLERGRDYELDEALGYISLRQRLQDSEAIAVAFQYQVNGQLVKVGDFVRDTGGVEGGQNGDRIVLKMLRSTSPRSPAPEAGFFPAAWYLELRNIYRLQGRGLNPQEFELDIFYEPPGNSAETRLPGVGGQQTLLQLLGLDRVNENGALSADNQFDYLTNYTIDPTEGYLIFPYLEPFGERISEVAGGDPEAEALYVFSELYTKKPETAEREHPEYNVYRIEGAYKGGVQSFYNLNAYAGIIEGSVRVTSGGATLQEGLDYTVDYLGGTVEITNPNYLVAGREIEIDYEQNSLFNFQKKTLLGVRADYELADRLAVGATLMRLNEKSQIDKFRIGEEPVSNTIWGVDGAISLEPRWLTRAIDALPLIQTRAPSAISITGEFAQIRPGNAQTNAFEIARDRLRDADRDFTDDQLRGISYIDDFEGFENTFSLKSPGAWQLAAPPDSIGAIDGMAPAPVLVGSGRDARYATWRGGFAWYQINRNLLEQLRGTPVYDARAIDQVQITDVFPNRDTRGERDRTLSTMDLHFDPRFRGPYNYTSELENFLNRPEAAWGGMTQRLPEGYTDFEAKNIDFIEFIVRVFPENERGDAGPDAKLYVDLGSISEDIVPNERLNNEDGLSLTTVSELDLDAWGRTPSSTQNTAINIDGDRTEDLGLDGLASYPANSFDQRVTETGTFGAFLSTLGGGSSARYDAEVARALADPSADDYHYFGDDGYFNDPTFFPNGGATVQQRFLRYFPGLELNGYEAQNAFGSSGRGNSRYPDTEDLNLNSTLDQDNSYFQYEIPLSRDSLEAQARPERENDYIVGEIEDQNGAGTGWYQVRIPIRKSTRQVGVIRDFTRVESIRIWTTGHRDPITMRLATLDLVGSQWQRAEDISRENVIEVGETGIPVPAASDEAELTISSINNEENAGQYAPPLSAIISQTRLPTGGTQNAREQALVLRVENLKPRQQRAIFKAYNQGLDLLRYENLRMAAHLEGRLGDGTDLSRLPPEEARGKVLLFVRLGASETNDYYEYEQPLSPSPEVTGASAEQLWLPDLNAMNLRLGALNELKVARDNLTIDEGLPADSILWSNDPRYSAELGELDAALEAFAPPGTRIGIKGTPSLGRVNTIVIGVRNGTPAYNAALSETISEANVWVNELRVSGYDETNGWSALANADVLLADLGRVKASFQTQTDGFGSLASTLAEREQDEIRNWGVTADLNADKLVAERYGWSAPVSVQVQSNTSTPRFAPSRGDVRLEEILRQIDRQGNLSEAEKEAEKQEAIDDAQDYSLRRSFAASLSKTDSDSRLLRNTLDGVSLNYSFSDTDARSPTLRLRDTWNWSGTAAYRFSARPKTVRPFWFLGGVPLIRFLGGLDFNYVPQTLSVSGNVTRNFSQSQDRPRSFLVDSTSARIPDRIEFPLREQHSFGHRRNFQLQYNPFEFLNLSFDTNTNQSLSTLGVDTLYALAATRGPEEGDLLIDLNGSSEAEARAVAAEEGFDFGENAFVTSRLRVVPTGQVLGRIFSDEGPRTEQYGQRFTGTLRPTFGQDGFLDWVNVQDLSYSVQYNWQNGAVGRLTGATVSNQASYTTGLSLQPQTLWQKFGFYRKLEEQQRQAEQEAQDARQRREQERQARREERRREQERRAQGEEPPQDEIPQDEPPQDDGPPEEAPPEEAPPDGEDAEAEEQDEEGGGGLRVPLPDPGSLLRRFVLAVTGVRDFTVTFSGDRSARSTGVGYDYAYDHTQTSVVGDTVRGVRTPYTFYDRLSGQGGPSIPYRFGLTRRIDDNQRVLSSALQVTDVFQDGNQIRARTALNPSSALQISLNWNADWRSTTSVTYLEPGADPDRTVTQSGENGASIWAFGASFRDLFDRQYETYVEDLEAVKTPGVPEILGDENGDGQVVLTNESVVGDFRQAFVAGLGPVDARGYLPFPLPSWLVNYTGLSNWPLLRRFTQSVTVRHGYSANYTTSYSTIGTLGSESLADFTFNNQTIAYVLPDYEASGVRVNERFQPLLGFDVAWKGQVQTNVQWNKSNAYALSSSSIVDQQKTSELSLTASYQKQGLRLPFLQRRLNNRISFNLTVSRSVSDDRRFLLRNALAAKANVQGGAPTPELLEALQGEPLNATTRLRVTPQVSYQFSNRVSANFTLNYEKFDDDVGRIPSSTTINGGFNVRVAISN